MYFSFQAMALEGCSCGAEYRVRIHVLEMPYTTILCRCAQKAGVS